MVSQREKRFLLPGDPGYSTTPGPGRPDGDGEELSRRPAAIQVPAPALPEEDDFHTAETVIDDNPPRAEALPTVRTGCVGRGNAGKTALFRALSDGPVGDFLGSGLHVDAGDPREVARMIRESEQTQRLLHDAGLPPTMTASQISYLLYEGAEPRAVYHLQEVIGQVLTHTLPDSAADQQARYDDYLTNLVNTDVLWAVVPCPPAKPGPRERRRYANDLRITQAYLREALRRRTRTEPAAVAVVLSKIDTLFGSAEEAQAALTDDVLERALGPLVELLRVSRRVSEAALIPVTAFGFGNAVVKEGPSARDEVSPPGTEDEPFGAEPTWVLREDAEAEPYNLDALFLWTLLYGLRGQENSGVPDRDRQARRVSDQLQGDLESANPWIVLLK